MSWVVNLFNPGQPTRFAPSNDRRPQVFSNLQNYDDEQDSKHRGRCASECAESMEEEEEDRHPYWHVSHGAYNKALKS